MSRHSLVSTRPNFSTRTAAGAVLAALVVVGVIAVPAPAQAGPEEKGIVINDEPTEGDELAVAHSPGIPDALIIDICCPA